MGFVAFAFVFIINLLASGFQLWNWQVNDNTLALALLPLNVGCALWMLALMVRD